MKLIKKLQKNASVYIGASFMNEAVPFLLLPVLTRYLSPADYGIWSTFIALSGNITVLIGMGTVSAVMRGYFDRKNVIFSEYVSNSLYINGIVFLASLFFIFLASSFISAKLGIPRVWIVSLPVIGILSVFYNLPLKQFIYEQKPFAFAILQFSFILLEITLSILFVVGLGLGWQGRGSGVLLNRLIFCVFGVFFLCRRKLVWFHLNKAYIRQILSYGFPMVLHGLGITIIATTDRIFLNLLAGPVATGIYSVAFSIASIIVFFNGALILAWEPILFETLNTADDKSKMRIVRYTYGMFALITGVALLVIIASPYIIRVIVGARFEGAIKFVLWLAMANIAHGMYVMMKSFIMYQKNTSLVGITAVVTVLASVVFNYLLIRRFGPIGAAQATFLTFMVRFLLVWYFGNRVFPMPWFSFIKKKKVCYGQI